MPPNITKTETTRAERIAADLLVLEKQVLKAFRRAGKVSLSKNSMSGARYLSVTSAAGSFLSVTLEQERKGALDLRYSVRVDGVADVNHRSKHRRRDFNGFTAKASAEDLEPVVACVEKHLAAKDEAATQRAERELESEKLKKLEKKRDTHFRAIGKRHGIKSGLWDSELVDGKLTVKRERETYTVEIDELSEVDLERVLTFWRSFRPETPG